MVGALLGWQGRQGGQDGQGLSLGSNQQNIAKVTVVTPMIWLQKIVASVLLVNSFYCLVGLHTWWEIPPRPAATSPPGPKALVPSAHKAQSCTS